MSAPSPSLGPLLERLCGGTDRDARIAADPVRFVHAFESREDREIAAVLASCLAYGRVAGFGPVLERVFASARAHGGPRAWVDRFDPAVHGSELTPIVYRWNRGIDLVLLLAALRHCLPDGRPLEALLPADGPLELALDRFVVTLRDGAVAVARTCEVDATSFEELPRGFRTLLPRPADGSACKRWWMFLRWMVRPAADGVDLGLWTTRRPSELRVPLDTHVARISRFLGLTARTDGSLRTAREITSALSRYDADDPVRYDFAIAHLGISGGCRGHRDSAICPSCPLDPACVAGG